MKLKIPIDTPPQGRPRFTRSGIVYDHPRAKKFKADLSLLILSQLGEITPFMGAVRVEITVRRAGFRKGATSRRFGDIDNLAKIILDAITQTKAIWLDDSQIVELNVRKATAGVPSIELKIEEVVEQ